MKRGFWFIAVLILIVIGTIGCGNSEDTMGEEVEDLGVVAENTDEDQSGDEIDLDYPNRTIEFIVGAGTGGGTDIFARQVAKQLSENLNVTINVVNKEGATGTIALEDYMSRDPDGYTIAPVSLYDISVADGLTPYTLDTDLRGLARFQMDVTGFQALSDGPYNTWEKVYEAAKENPGELSIGGTYYGAFDHITVLELQEAAGIEFNYVPFDSAGEMHAALLGGHIDLMAEQPGPTADYLEEGRLVLLQLWAEDRLDEFPDVPTAKELGYDLSTAAERGFIIHKDTPEEIVSFLEKELKKVYDSEEYKEYEENSHLHYLDGWLDSDGYDERLRSNIKNFGALLELLD